MQTPRTVVSTSETPALIKRLGLLEPHRYEHKDTATKMAEIASGRAAAVAIFGGAKDPKDDVSFESMEPVHLLRRELQIFITSGGTTGPRYLKYVLQPGKAKTPFAARAVLLNGDRRLSKLKSAGYINKEDWDLFGRLAPCLADKCGLTIRLSNPLSTEERATDLEVCRLAAPPLRLRGDDDEDKLDKMEAELLSPRVDRV